MIQLQMLLFDLGGVFYNSHFFFTKFCVFNFRSLRSVVCFTISVIVGILMLLLSQLNGPIRDIVYGGTV